MGGDFLVAPLTIMYNAIKDPVGTQQNIDYMVNHPAETWEAIKGDYSEKSQTWRGRGEITTEAASTVLLLIAAGRALVGKLGKAAEIVNVGDRASALKVIGDLPAEIRSSAKSFFKEHATNKDINFVVERTADGDYVLSFTKPGKDPGSYAVYSKKLNSKGELIEVRQQAFDSEGNLVHDDVKVGVGAEE